MLKQRIGIAITAFVIWFVLSGKTEPKFLIIGAVTAVLVSYLCTPMLHTMKNGKRYFILKVDYPRFFLYFLWLFKEIIVSSWDITKTVIHPVKKIHYQLLRFECSLENPAAVTLFINSITLTPGTITIDVDGQIFTVNALTDVAAEGLIAGEMQRRIAKLYHEDLSVPRLERETFGVPVKK